MSEHPEKNSPLPPAQQRIRDKCFHPSGTFVEFPMEDVETSIPARFEKIVRMHPERLALKQDSRCLSYEELNRAANRVAYRLVARRGASSEPVAIYLKDRMAMIIAILGVLKAGKFYVPLEPSFPQSRNAFVIKDCGVELILTDRGNAQAAEQFGVSLATVLMEEAELVKREDNPGISIGAANFAYVLHTSGSTGNFKGIGETHRNLLYDIQWFLNHIHVCHADRLTLLHSVSSAASGLHLFGSLLSGASLLSYDVGESGVVGLADWLRREEITVWHSLPMVFREMIGSVSVEDVFPLVRVVQLSSAPVVINDVENYRKHFSPSCIFLHRIGSTEALTISAKLIDQTTPVSSEPMPLGWPPAEKRLLILDDNGREVGAGETGEIAVKSRFLAEGYWGRHELSKDRFQSGLNDDGDRLFLTGDLGRISTSDGLTLLGRKDSQIKVRGFRIEPEQVERALLNHPGVREAIVIGAADGASAGHLVAYFTSADSTAPKSGVLRKYLSQRLPDYMIPSRFIQLAKIPLTPNGKVNRRELPSPTDSRPDLDSLYLEAQSIIERQLVEIWQDVLQVIPIGIHDNFFDLGGNSLAASRVIARVIQRFRWELPIKALFDAPNIVEMARVIEQNQAKQASEETIIRMLSEIEAMTEEEAQKALSGNTT